MHPSFQLQRATADEIARLDDCIQQITDVVWNKELTSDEALGAIVKILATEDSNRN
jgi:hypothetical protein